MENIRIYISNNSYLIREGLKKTLKKLKEVSIVGESDNLLNLPNLISKSQADILILEMNHCSQPVGDIVTRLKEASPHTKILVIPTCDCELPVISSIRAGVAGFLKKDVTQNELLNAVQNISNGKEYYSQEVAGIMMKTFSQENKDNNFSEREIEILTYICRGRSNEQIADILFLSEKTVATHKRNIMKKATVKKTSDLILWALDNKIIEK